MRDPAEVDWITVETATPQPYPAVIPAADLAALRADLAAAQADAATWQAKCLELREIVLRVEDYADDPSAANAQALVDHFRAFQRLVEGATPRVWAVEPVAAPGAGFDEWEARVDAADTECPF